MTKANREIIFKEEQNEKISRIGNRRLDGRIGDLRWDRLRPDLFRREHDPGTGRGKHDPRPWWWEHDAGTRRGSHHPLLSRHAPWHDSRRHRSPRRKVAVPESGERRERIERRKSRERLR